VTGIFAPERRPVLIALLAACAFFMEQLDGSIIATALPQMAKTFHENPVNLSIGISAYLLTLAIFIPASGWMADRYGSKNVFLGAIAIFTAASVLCGWSNALWSFTAARVLQGFGGAMMVPVGRLVVLRTSDKRDLINMMQLVSVPGLVAPVIGPPVGGFITTFASWRWIFYLNVPIGLLGLALVAAFMTNYRAEERRSFDTMGFFLSGIGLAALLFGLNQLGVANLDRAIAYVLIAFGAVFCALAAAHMLRAPHPLLDLSLLRIPTFALPTLFAGAGLRVVIGSTPFLWPLMFQIGMGMTAFVSGLVFFACAAGDLWMKAYSARLVRRFGFRRTLLYNGFAAAAAFGLCATFSATTPFVVIALVLFAIGMFRSVQFGNVNALAYVDIPPERMSAATSLASTTHQVLFGSGIAFGALALQLGTWWNHTPPPNFTVADFRVAFIVGAALIAISSARFARLDPRAGAAASGHRAGGREALGGGELGLGAAQSEIPERLAGAAVGGVRAEEL